MKKAAAILLAALLAGCDRSPIDKQGRTLAQEDSEKKNVFHIVDNGGGYHFRYVIIDGHEYLLARHDRGLGITHSPKCKCLER